MIVLKLKYKFDLLNKKLDLRNLKHLKSLGIQLDIQPNHNLVILVRFGNTRSLAFLNLKYIKAPCIDEIGNNMIKLQYL